MSMNWRMPVVATIKRRVKRFWALDIAAVIQHVLRFVGIFLVDTLQGELSEMWCFTLSKRQLLLLGLITHLCARRGYDRSECYQAADREKKSTSFHDRSRVPLSLDLKNYMFVLLRVSSWIAPLSERRTIHELTQTNTNTFPQRLKWKFSNNQWKMITFYVWQAQ